jgi:hypothetical protein
MPEFVLGRLEELLKQKEERSASSRRAAEKTAQRSLTRYQAPPILRRIYLEGIRGPADLGDPDDTGETQEVSIVKTLETEAIQIDPNATVPEHEGGK